MAKLFWKKGNPPPWLEKLGWRIEAAMLGSLWLAVKPVSPRRAASIGYWLMSRLGPRVNKHKHVLANLRMVHPDKSDEQIQQLAASCWGNLGTTLAEFNHLKTLFNRHTDEPAIEIVNTNASADFKAFKQPCIFIAAHLGNWEISGFAIHTFGYPIDVVYSPFSNPYLDNMVQQARAVTGCGFIPKVNALRAMYKSLKNNRSVGLHVDVRVDDGDLYPLCGVGATTTAAPAWLALKTGFDIVPVVTKRLPDGKYRCTLYPALTKPADPSSKTAIDELTAEMNRVMGTLIQEHADQWLCTKRRWPKDSMLQRGAY